jgi:hypothetical protein
LYRIREQDPIKQRAPVVAMLHLTVMLVYLSTLYILENNPLKSWKVEDHRDIPLMRRISQKMVVSLRTCFTIFYVLRTLVIYCQWKCTRNSSKFLKAMASEKIGILLFSALIVIANVIASVTFDGGNALFYPSLTWFCPSCVLTYSVLNSGFFAIIEVTALVTCAWILRHFPENFGVRKEAIGMAIVCFLCTSFSNILNPFGLGDLSTECSQTFPPYFISQFFFEYIRILSLAIMIYFFNRPHPMPLPTPTRLLSCFKIFMTNFLCVQAFIKFVEAKEDSTLVEQLQNYMLEQLQDRLPREASNPRPDSNGSIPRELREAFKEYRETKSFAYIKAKLVEYESVFHLRFRKVMY